MLTHQNAMYPSSESSDGAPTCLNMLASPRSDPSLLCKYKSGKCSNRRATKRNGQLHTLCHFHRVRQNEHQRKSDRKHRMVNVARHAKLGSLGALLATEQRRGSRRTSLTSVASDFTSDSGFSAPASPMDVGQHIGGSNHHLHQLPGSSQDAHERYAFPAGGPTPSMLHMRSPSDEAGASPIHWRRNLARMATQVDSAGAEGGIIRSDYPMTPEASGSAVGTPTGRLPPISFLTQQIPGKLDAFRSPNSAMGLPFPPSSFLQGQSNATSSEASKTA
jgi:hypothetical protein